MLPELDMLLAIVALSVALPVLVFQMSNSQSLSSLSLTQLGERLILSSEAQKLAFQLASIGSQATNLSYAINGSGYVLLPYGRATVNASENGNYVRVVVTGGRLYYMLVRK